MMSHSADFAISPLIAILSNYHNALVPPAVVEALRRFPGEHFVNTSAYSIPYDSYPRRITAWLSDGISIGAESFNESVVGGPAINPTQFNPAVIQWDTGAGVGFITVRVFPFYKLLHHSFTLLLDDNLSTLTDHIIINALQLHATEKAIDAVAGPGYLNITYPYGTSASQFQLLVSTFANKADVSGWEDVQGLKVIPSGTVDPNMRVAYSMSDGTIK